MPKGSRKDNARNSKQARTYLEQPSPPTQLPTPLPDEQLAVNQHLPHVVHRPDLVEDSNPNLTLSRLIDFDTPTPPQPVFPLPSDHSLDMESSYIEEGDMENTYRSPPFREAQLPQDSPPPLPIPPRASPGQIPYPNDEGLNGDEDYNVAEDISFLGHSISPNFSRSSSTTSQTPISPTYSNYGSSSSVLGNFTRTIRGYVPSSINVPAAGPSPPLVSRPVSFGLFSNSPGPPAQSNTPSSHRKGISQQEFERDYERNDEGEDQYYGYGQHQREQRGYQVSVTHQPQPLQPPVDVHALASHGQSTATVRGSGLAQAMKRSGNLQLRPPPKATSVQSDAITWAHWDTLQDRKLLFLGYECGLQIWDCTNLGSVDEVLNLNLDTEEWRSMLGRESSSDTGMRVVHAAVLPPPSRQAIYHSGGDLFEAQRHLLGILLEPIDVDEREQEPQSTFVLYSVSHRHQLIKRLNFRGLPSTLTANEHFVVISTTTPSALHILSSTTFHTLHTISTTALESFAPPSSSSQSTTISISNALSPASSKSVLLSPIEAGGSGSPTIQRTSVPRPIFALSHRLLAFASPSRVSSSPHGISSSKDSRRLSSSSSTSAPSAPGSSISSSPFGVGFGGLGKLTQADVSHAALKVGESVFSGMKFLGGMALDAAKSRVPVGTTSGLYVGGAGEGAGGRPGTSAGGGRFVSRSAPDYPAGVDEEVARGLKQRTYSNTSSASSSGPGAAHAHSTTVAPYTRPVAETGYHVTVVDLLSLLSREKNAKPTQVDEFVASHSQPVAKLNFAADGTTLGATFRDGRTVKEFKLRPTSSVLSSSRFTNPEDGEATQVDPRSQGAVQVYDLRRGTTSAVVEGIARAEDGRWIGVGTRNRTVHVYAVNPYGGKTDLRSHLEGRVRNVDIVDPPATLLTPIARLRGSKSISNVDQPRAPLAFTFISNHDLSVSPNLLPPLSPPAVSQSPTLSPSPRGIHRTNYQHVLLFDAEDGVLSLYRLTLEKHLGREPGISGGVAASVQALGVTSISLPGMGGAGKLSSSPSSKPSSTIEQPVELGAKTSLVASYNLKRSRSWQPVAKPMGRPEIRRQASLGGDWLAEAELSTCSSSLKVLPRSLYLSHQFSFHTLGEDYHALVRSYQFHIVGSKIEVRREVEVNAYSSSGDNANFSEGFTAPRDIRRTPSSFDEPIASAISGSFDNSNIPAILPMYPNGIPGSIPKSLRNSIPIRAMAGLGDGVSEGFGRIRREMHKVRSPQGAARSDSSMSAAVPLEFDEEEEDFLDRDVRGIPPSSRDTSRDGASIDSASLITPANNSTQQLLEADVIGTVDEDMFNGWDREDKQAIEEAEQFHDIATVGYLDEERDRRDQQAAPPTAPGIRKKGKKRGN